jgi:hypothetical protein
MATMTITYEVRDGKFAETDEAIMAAFFRIMRETNCHPTESDYYGAEGDHPYGGKPYIVVTAVGNNPVTPED